MVPNSIVSTGRKHIKMRVSQVMGHTQVAFSHCHGRLGSVKTMDDGTSVWNPSIGSLLQLGRFNTTCPFLSIAPTNPFTNHSCTSRSSMYKVQRSEPSCPRTLPLCSQCLSCPLHYPPRFAQPLGKLDCPPRQGGLSRQKSHPKGPAHPNSWTVHPAFWLDRKIVKPFS